MKGEGGEQEKEEEEGGRLVGRRRSFGEDRPLGAWFVVEEEEEVDWVLVWSMSETLTRSYRGWKDHLQYNFC